MKPLGIIFRDKDSDSKYAECRVLLDEEDATYHIDGYRGNNPNKTIMSEDRKGNIVWFEREYRRQFWISTGEPRVPAGALGNFTLLRRRTILMLITVSLILGFLSCCCSALLISRSDSSSPSDSGGNTQIYMD